MSMTGASCERARIAQIHRRSGAGSRPKAFQPDDFEAAQIRTAIELRAARPGDDAPRPEFLNDLHARLAEQMTGAPRKRRRIEVEHDAPPGRRRDVGRRGCRGHGGIRRPTRHRRASRSPRRVRGTHAQRRALDARGGQFGRARRGHASF